MPSKYPGRLAVFIRDYTFSLFSLACVRCKIKPTFFPSVEITSIDMRVLAYLWVSWLSWQSLTCEYFSCNMLWKDFSKNNMSYRNILMFLLEGATPE